MPEIPPKLSPAEAMAAIHRAMERYGGVAYSRHVERDSGPERRFDADDVQRVLLRGQVMPDPIWDDCYANWKYKVCGRDFDGCPLTLVVAIEPDIDRVTVITGHD